MINPTLKITVKISIIFSLLGIMVFTSFYAKAQDPITRKELLTVNIGQSTISKVDVKEIEFKPGQITKYHKHPCPVISYIVSGSVLFQVEGDSSQILKAGNVVYEPANKPIVHFDNISQTDSLKFIPYYLLNKDTTLIEMLNPNNKK